MNSDHAKFLETIEKQLAVEPFSVGGMLQKYVVINRARDADAELLGLLLQNDELKAKFFKQVAGALVFDHSTFVWYLEQKNYLNDSYTAYKNKVGLTVGGKSLKQRNEVALVWPFKDCYLEGGQSKEEDKRDEIFFNEVLAQDEITELLSPKALTNAAVHDKNGRREFKTFARDAETNKSRGLPADTITDNLIIKGNNLLALHSLKKQFAGKVKLIYIDPPYNTGGDANIFTYNNSFNHSTWLTFMKNRLEAAKGMLRDDGFIAIAIDHAELFYLGVLADEVFGRNNRLGIITVVHKSEGRQFAKGVNPTNEFMLWFARDKANASLSTYPVDEEKLAEFDEVDESGKFRWEDYIRMGGGDTNLRCNKEQNWYPVFVSPDLRSISLTKKTGWHKVFPVTPSGVERTWNTSKDTFQENIDAQNVKVVTNEDDTLTIFRKVRAKQTIKTHWDNPKYNATRYGTQKLNSIVGAGKFSYPKSIHVVLDTLKIMTDKNDIIMDFFAGSGTTGHAVLALNEEDRGDRQFILVEQLDEHITVCKERIAKVMKSTNSDASFVYCELKQSNEKFMDGIQAADTSRKLLSVWQKMKENSFLDYNLDMKKQEANLEEFTQLELAEQKRHLCEILDKNQLYVNLSSLGDRDRACSATEKKLNADFYRTD